VPLESIIETYGYVALFFGTMIEGEAVLLIAAFMAHRGYLALHWVIAVAFFASVTIDHLLFQLGRTRGQAFLEKHPGWKPRVARVRRILERHHGVLVPALRFLFGLRTATPFTIGMSGVSLKRFALLDAIGAIAWASTYGTLGYVFGVTAERLFTNVQKYELWIVTGALLSGGALWAGRYAWQHFRARVSQPPLSGDEPPDHVAPS
jgi:membrane protein DedA with SNARE-associated domain